MIKRLLIIGGLTGVAHLSTIFVLKKLTGVIPIESIKVIGELDAQFYLITSILAAGLLMNSVREIAVSHNWQRTYFNGQQARMTLSILLVICSVVGFLNPEYFFLAAAPLFALNGDYLLYGKGRPVTASLLAFLRVFIPSSAVFLGSFFWPKHITAIFASSTIFMYLFSGVVISRLMDVPYWFFPDFKSLKSYLKSFYLGIVSFSYYFLGLGLILLSDFLYPTTAVALAYVSLKVYVIYKGVLRIIIQAFFSEMVDQELSKKVDQLTTIVGMAFLISATFFSEGFLSLFVDKSKTGDFSWIYIIGIIGFLISPFISLTTTALFEKKDRGYAWISVMSMVLASISCIVFSFFATNEKSILISLGIGEVLSVIGLIIILNKTSILKQRLLFILKNLPLLIIPLGLLYFWGDNFFTFLAFLLLFFSFSLVLNKNEFKLTKKVITA